MELKIKRGCAEEMEMTNEKRRDEGTEQKA